MEKGGLCDTHIHTKYSCDSVDGLEAYCLAAIQKEVHTLCFTDHVDHNPKDHGCGYYDPRGFLDDFQAARDKYEGKLTLLCGIEFGDPHMYPDRLAEYAALGYDFILGTVHFWYKDMYPSEMIEEGVTAAECYSYYWKEVLAAIKSGGFDSLGHIDFPKRYYRQLVFDPDVMAEACTIMAKGGISLEINTSSLRKDIGAAMPDKEILAVYKSCGGRYVTLGSDAHRTGDLAAGFSYARGLISYFGLEPVAYAGRAPFAVDV